MSNPYRKTRLKSAEKVRNYKANRESSVTILDIPGQTVGNLKSLSGECPPANKAISWVCDSLEKRAYLVGGRRHSDEDCVPTTDFYRLDISSMKWTNLTDSLKYRDVGHPFSFESCRRRIPELTLPGHALFRLHNTSFLLLFGGYDADSERVSSSLLVINLRDLEWWYQPVEGGIAAGRIDPTMVAIDRKLYIFGGYRRFGDNFGDPHNSYSIASLADDGKAWSWEVQDVSYPGNIPPGTRWGRATPIYEGTKILLTTWRTTNDDCFDLTENDLFCFHIERRKFQLIDVSGDFPKNLDYYYTFPMPELRIGSILSTREVATPNPGPSHAPHPSRPLVPPSSAIICGWMDWADRTLTAEVWYLQLTPIERITKLNIASIIADLDSPLDVESDKQAGLQEAVMIGERLFLLGSRPKPAPARNSDRVFNTYFEVPLRRLCARKS